MHGLIKNNMEIIVNTTTRHYLSLSFADFTERALRRAQFARQCVYCVVGRLPLLHQRLTGVLHLSLQAGDLACLLLIDVLQLTDPRLEGLDDLLLLITVVLQVIQPVSDVRISMIFSS